MNAPFRKPLKLAGIAVSVAGALGFGTPVESGTLDIATEPLGTALTAIKPNVMFILDDSGSMFREYMPEHVVAPSADFGGAVGILIPGSAACFDSGDNWDGETAGNINGSIDPCWPGDPPYMSPDFNTIYYNPAIQYRPAINFDGTLKPSQDRTYTSTWTAVRTDEYNVENWNQLVDTDRDASIESGEQSAAIAAFTHVNLATGYPDRVWCTTTSEVMTGTTCRTNSAYLYPDHDFPYGMSGGAGVGNPRFTTGAPYYYRMQTTQYCLPNGTDCKHGTQITTAHTREEVEYCVDTELTNCAAGTAKTTAHVHTGVRWCNNANLLESPVTDNPRVNYCQRKKIGTFIHAKHVGKVISQSGTIGARPAEGNIFVSAVAAGGGTITSITIGTTTVATNVAIGAGSTTTQAATAIAAAIEAHADYLGAPFGANAAITAAVNGTAFNGLAVTVTSSGTVTQGGRATLALGTVAGGSKTISSIRLGAIELLCTNLGAAIPFGSSVFVNAGINRIEAQAGWDTLAEVSDVMQAAAARINACTSVSGFSASQTAGGKIVIFANTSVSSDGIAIGISHTGTGSGGFSASLLAGTVRPLDIRVNTTNMAGGANGTSGTRFVRIGVGKFTRTDIIPNIPTYARASTRNDCVSSGTTCTWEEEMTNFANWYTYYRSRLKMMKTAAGRAFASVPESYRVGFITINPMTSGSINNNKYLRVAPFDDAVGGHKSTFFSKLYSQTAASFTPLREALSRVGHLYAGKVGSNDTTLTNGIPAADDPMTISCQPNFAILSTDGYWNKVSTSTGDIPLDLNSVQIGNQDNVDSGFSTRASGAYDGNLSSTFATASTPGGSGTLADVAMYYYKTDLRTTGSFATNNVPTTNKDTNPAQHMVTFTLGLGLDGELTYRSDYETALTGDFAAIKAGTKNWPIVQGDTPSALDDLWHAAVNGRGVFFSASDPDTLANALTDTLNALTTRIGAGAAAATSNLQPVAGDNFAFTAQYQTGTWVGDLKARTIDLTSGIVSAVTLWSASSLLDLMDHPDRNIYTYGGRGAANPTTAQKKKHFCHPADFGAPWCSDGGVNNGLDVTELAYFNPAQLDQFSDYTAGQLTQASSTRVMHFIRGERIYEDTASALDTDLFRPRQSLLGDIINAQPSYVKKSPFQYGDSGYAAFKKCTEGGTPAPAGCPAALFPDTSKARLGSVFAASNDGMLHAFETDVNNNPYFQTAGIGTDVTGDDTFSCDAAVCNLGNGVERWAYVPGLVMPDLFHQADNPYVHRYYTDGSPTVADVCVASNCATAVAGDWRTIMVAGLNAGGIGYYALDITNPSPSGFTVLWEFTHRGTCWTDAEIAALDKTHDCHLGLSYGNPIIAKRRTDGKWVVIVSSGYNNTATVGTAQGNGQGYLYILEAQTGIILNRISTGVGTTGSPSGLAKINGFVNSASTDNTVLAVYGGDLEGNLWRIGLETTTPVVVKVAQTKEITTGLPQPITVKPELGKVDANPDIRVIMFGTGKFLEETDKSNVQRQTIYALRDDPADDTGPIIADVRAGSISVRTIGLINENTRTIVGGTAPSWAGSGSYGWLIDLPLTGERVNVDPQLQLGTLIVSTNVPSTDSCSAGGSSWLNFLDYATGSYVQGSGGSSGTRFPSSLAVGINVIMLPGGRVVTIVTTADNQQLTQNTPVPAGGFGGRRVSWRELIRE